MARLVTIFVALLAFLQFSAPAFAERRVALVIGNSAYAKTGKLANPANDANAIADLLRRAGFEISEARLDLGLAAFKRALSDFEVNSKSADIAAFYFSGHGVQIGGQDFLLPVDAELARDVDAQDEAVSLDRVLRATEGARRLRLVIVDACRDNPFVARMQNVVATKSVARGLAPPVEAADTLIAFAARAGTQAIDGASGANSPFAAAILRHLAEPGLDVQLAFRQVRDDVMAATNGRQEPYTYGSLGGPLIALLPPPQSTPLSQVPQPESATSAESLKAACDKAIASNDPPELVEYDNAAPKPKKGTTVNQKQQFLALAAGALRRHTPVGELGPGDAKVTFRVTAGGTIADVSATGSSASHVALACKIVSSIRLPPPPGGAFVASQAFAFH